tara:strand:+ start:10089 stop:11159 length:1071 start_codon:yes stop_codon:yes gene_type:complete
MTGYQEMLTDPSYAGQLLTLTYPMIGNYGVDTAVEESEKIQPSGLIVREVAPTASHLNSTNDLGTFLSDRGVIAIEGVDTRAITRRIRSQGVMLGVITTESVEDALAQVRSLPGYDDIDWASQVTTEKQYGWGSFAKNSNLLPAVEPIANKAVSTLKEGPRSKASESHKKVVLIDGGVKRNIMRSLTARECDITVLPIDATAEQVLALRPDGIVWSPGPGDPQVQNVQVEETKKLIGKVPILGICLGHQVIARALGAGTFKLPFGHRGGNHPVRDERTGSVTITAQNHGYAVDPIGLDASAEVSHVNLNDGTVEGITMRDEPVMTIQFHSEASPGPLDSMSTFDHFVEMMATAGVK